MGNNESSWSGLMGAVWPGGGSDDTKKYIVKQSSDNLWSISNVVDPEIETADNTELVTEFSHHVSHDDLADFVDISIQRLRVLRHPNLLKFLSSYAYDDSIYLLTESVSPLEVVIKSLNYEELIKGLRDIARGLHFIHETALLAHNNLHVGNIFVREKTWCWKIGGFECALELKRVDDKFLEDIALIRKSSVIPPEDKVKGPTKSPPYTRDMWAFGQLVIAMVTTMESSPNDGLLDHSKTCLLSDDPGRRISAGQVLKKPWLRNELTDIVEFLQQLTVKNADQKSEFFRSLPARLLSLPSQTLCRHIVPLLLTPLAMGEPAAQQYLWKHLFTPVIGERRHHFDPDAVCPLILESDYHRHVLTHIISLLESREGHIRQVLLENLEGFSSVCSSEDMETIVLPQVLIGLQETDNDLVAATLQGLSKMVPVLGADVVMGTTRKSVFVNTRPKTPCNEVGNENNPKLESYHNTTPSVITKPLTSTTKLSRQEQMKAKREAMKLKKDAGNPKFGTKKVDNMKTTSISSIQSKDSYPNSEVTTAEGDTSSNEEEGSVSRTGNDDDNMDDDFKAWDDEDQLTEAQPLDDVHTPASVTASTDNNNNDDWDDSEWPAIEPVAASSWERSTEPVTSKTVGTSNGASAHSVNTNGSGASLLKNSKSLHSSKISLATTESDSSLKGRLNQSDIERLKQQAEWSKEPDYFADMQPVVSNKSKSSTSLSVKENENIANGDATAMTTITSSTSASKLSYVPNDEGPDGWNDDFDWQDEES